MYRYKLLLSCIGLTAIVLFCTVSCSKRSGSDSVEDNIKNFTVTFTGGSVRVSTQFIRLGDVAREPEQPAREGYKFEGWYSSPNLREIYDFSSPIIQDMVLYSKWKREYTVHFQTNGGSIIQSEIVDSNTSIPRPEDPTRKGFIFSGWYGEPNFVNEYDFFSVLNQDTTLYVRWVPQGTTFYKVDFNVDGGVAIPNQNIDSLFIVKEPTTPIKEGFTFLGWFTSRNSDDKYVFSSPVTQDLTLYARWLVTSSDIQTHTVTFNTNGGDNMLPTFIMANATMNKPSDPTNEKNGALFFVDWYSDSTLKIVYDFTLPVISDITLYAKWQYMVTFDMNSQTITGLNPVLDDNEDINLILPSNINGIMVTDIARGAFLNSTNIGRLTIREGIKHIGDYAFRGCENIKGNLILSDSINTIGAHAFENCYSFDGSLIIPNSVDNLGINAFNNCHGFDGILNISNALTTIGIGTFSNCYRLKGNLTIPNAVETIGSGAFVNCYGFDGNLTIPNAVETIGSGAFANCYGLYGDLTIPHSVKTMGDNVFYNCNGLNGSLTISDSVEAIGDNVFYNCSGFNGSLTIPDSVETIGDNAFYNCYGFSGNLIISNLVNSIGDNAFGNMILINNFIFRRNNRIEELALGSNMFKGIVIPRIIVPTGTLGAYASKNRLSQYSSYIREQ